MTSTRAFASLGAATMFVGASVLSATVVPPTANASPLDGIRSAVNGVRQGAPCGPLNYSIALEGEAQSQTGNTSAGVPAAGQYNGTIRKFLATGDPAQEAINKAVGQATGAIRDCNNKDFGVGFFRVEEDEIDFVSIALGAPPAPPPQAPAPEAPKPEPASAPAPAKVAPKDAVRLSFDRGLATWTANVTNSSDIAGNCTYAATNRLLPGVNRSFEIGPKGSSQFTVPAPPPLSTYNVVVSCRGPFEGQTVEFGRVEQTVP